MNSMTGYGQGTVSLGTHTAQVELASVNKRNLEIFLSLPKEWQDLEPKLQQRLREKILRGRVNGTLKITPNQEAAGQVAANHPGIKASIQNLRTVADDNGIPFAPDAMLLFRIVNEQVDSTLPAWQGMEETLWQAVDEAVEEFLAMRATEGRAMKTDMEQRLEALGQLLETLAPFIPGQAPAYRQTLLKRLKEAGLELNVEDDRVLREIALYAEKCDVSEEVTRLQSHLSQMKATLLEDGTIGRKLEFILQEIFREFNTLGNKSSDLRIIQAVIDAKAEVEKLREQALNVE